MLSIAQSVSDPESDHLISSNRPRLRKIFAHHFPSREGKISVQEFFNLCKNVRLFPDLLSLMDLKRLMRDINLSSQVSYLNFELLLKLVAANSFNSKAPLIDKLWMLLIHIRNASKMHYQVNLSFQAKKEAVSDLENPEIKKKKKVRSPKSGYVKTNPSSPSNKGQKTLSFSQRSRTNILQKKLRSPSLTDSRKILSVERVIEHKNSACSSTFEKPEITDLFCKFKNRHFALTAKEPHVQNSNALIRKQYEYIASVRKNMFKGNFIKQMIFNAWKNITSKHSFV